MSGRQVKAAERELSRSRRIARAQRWYVKQRQVSRKYARTVKHEHCVFVMETEQDSEGFEHAVARVDDFHKKLKIILARWENSHFTLNDSVRNNHTDLLRDFDYKVRHLTYRRGSNFANFGCIEASLAHSLSKAKHQDESALMRHCE